MNRPWQRAFLLFIMSIIVFSPRPIASSEFNPAINQKPAEGFLYIERVEIKSTLFSVYLEVRFNWSALPPLACSYWNYFYESLCLSLDNASYIEIKTRYITDEILSSNGTSTIRVHNSLVEPFPFDLDKNETLYAWILWRLCDDIRYRSNSVTVRSSIPIHRMRYFLIDWRIPSILFSIVLPLLAVYIVARKARKKGIDG